MSKILVSGNSFGTNKNWTDALFPNATVTNLSKAGGGNLYISDSIIYNIDINDPPDMVFVLWGLVKHFDMVVPYTKVLNSELKNYKYKTKLGGHYYIFTGGDIFKRAIKQNYNNLRNPIWPDVNTVEEFLMLPIDVQIQCTEKNMFPFQKNTVIGKILEYAMLQYVNQSTLETLAYKSMIACQTFLKQYNIPYRFGFCANPFNSKFGDKIGCLTKKHQLYHCVDWSNCAKISQSEFGFANNLLAPDGFHLTPEGQRRWAEEIKDIL